MKRTEEDISRPLRTHTASAPQQKPSLERIKPTSDSSFAQGDQASSYSNHIMYAIFPNRLPDFDCSTSNCIFNDQMDVVSRPDFQPYKFGARMTGPIIFWRRNIRLGFVNNIGQLGDYAINFVFSCLE